MKKTPPLVSICCITYNQKAYIRQCLDGFLMQNTSFALEIIVHDDASTDGTQDIIKEYAIKHPELFKVIIQKENQYSKGVNVLNYVFNCAVGKYIAICEGDDYWKDPFKLQKQVDFLEENKEYTMACSDAVIETNGGYVDWCRYNFDADIPIEDIILNGGLFVQTASLVFRSQLLDNYPLCCTQCHVGDYPLILFAALNGKIRWFVEKQVVYRFLRANSWTATNDSTPLTNRINGWRSEIDMLSGLNTLSGFKYKSTFHKRQANFIYDILRRNLNKCCIILREFDDIKPMYSLPQRIGITLMKYHI